MSETSQGTMLDDLFKTAVHTPVFWYQADAIYTIAAATYRKQPIMKTDIRKSDWNDSFIYKYSNYSPYLIANFYGEGIPVMDEVNDVPEF
jgi:hypothetical protein